MAALERSDLVGNVQGAFVRQEVACVCSASKNKDLAMEWVKYMTSPKVQSKLVYTKAFKARGPNMKIVDHWDDDQKALLSYVPDPENPGQMLVETLAGVAAAAGLGAAAAHGEVGRHTAGAHGIHVDAFLAGGFLPKQRNHLHRTGSEAF